MIKHIKYTLILSLFCFSCRVEKPIHVEEIVYSAFKNSEYGIIGGMNSLFFLTPDIGFSFMQIRKKLGQYPIGTAFRKTIDGGKTWNTISFFNGNIEGIQYWGGILYAYYNEISIKQRYKIPSPSHILISKDMGYTWEQLYGFDSEISNFHVFDSLNMSIIKTENDANWIYQSKDGGGLWTKANVPYAKNTDFVSRDGNKLYYIGDGYDPTYEKTYLYNYDVVNGVLDEQIFNTNFIYAMYVSDGMLAMDLNGCNIKYYTLKQGDFKLISKIRWGAWFRGSVMPKPLAKDGEYVFSFISQFPGGDEITQALYFSQTGGRRWREIREFKHGYGIGYNDYNVYNDDTIFQIAYPSMDSLRIFRIKKRVK